MSKPTLAVAAAAVFTSLALIAAPASAAVKKKKVKKPAAAVAMKQVAAADATQMAAAERVIYGGYGCEFSQSVSVVRDTANPGYVNLKFGKQSWTMKPVVSSTGAVRMEDVKGGALMLQIANKSMLMNTKTGQRMVDECKPQTVASN